MTRIAKKPFDMVEGMSSENDSFQQRICQRDTDLWEYRIYIEKRFNCNCIRITDIPHSDKTDY